MVVGIWTFPSLLVHGEAIGHKAEDEEEGLLLLLPFLKGYWRYRIFQGNQEKTRIYKAKRKRERELHGKTQTKEEVECPVRYFISAASPSLLVFTDARNPIQKSQLK